MPASLPSDTRSTVDALMQAPRRRRRIDYALTRMRESWLLRGSAVLAFVDYGGVIALVLARRLPLMLAGMIVFMSLATWVFLLGWFPVLEETIGATKGVPGRAWIGRSLNAFAVGCAVLVHLLMAAMIVIRARS